MRIQRALEQVICEFLKHYTVVDGGYKTPCWRWDMSRTKNGYGRVRIKPKLEMTTHRFSWEVHHGSIPEGLCVLHHCDNRWCINPGHLFLGTYLDNHQDMDSKGRRVPPRGERHHKAKLTDALVIEMRRLKAEKGLGCKKLGRMFGVTPRTACSILSGKIWKHLLHGKTTERRTESEVRKV